MLTRMGDSAFDMSQVAAVVRHRPRRKGGPARVTVYLRECVAVELVGPDAEAFLRLLDALPPDGLGPVGARLAGVKDRAGKPLGREERG